MPVEATIIIILIGVLSVYIFYLVSIYVKLENRRSLILSKFTEVDTQLDNKLELVKKLLEIIDNNNIKETRINLLNSTNINDKIKFNKILDDLLEEVNDKKTTNIINSINELNEKINYSKEFYNESLYEYNMILSTIHGKILKKIFKYCEYNTF